MKKLYIIILISSVLLGCKEDKNTTVETKTNVSINTLATGTTPEKIAYKNGIENWNTISEIRYTFNVDRGGKIFFRSWIWKPKTGDISMKSATDTIRYNRNSIDSLSEKFDRAFINDKFWLMSPFNLVWDSGITFTEKQQVIAPISKDTLDQLTAVYSNEGGYTPGDAYDYFYDTNYQIKEWSFRKGNNIEPSLSTTWQNYKTINEITFATMHQDSSGYFKVYFTDLTIK